MALGSLIWLITTRLIESYSTVDREAVAVAVGIEGVPVGGELLGEAEVAVYGHYGAECSAAALHRHTYRGKPFVAVDFAEDIELLRHVGGYGIGVELGVFHGTCAAFTVGGFGIPAYGDVAFGNAFADSKASAEAPTET